MRIRESIYLRIKKNCLKRFSSLPAVCVLINHRKQQIFIIIDDPGTFITPNEKAVKGTQVSLLEELEIGGKDVAKLKIKSSGDTTGQTPQ